MKKFLKRFGTETISYIFVMILISITTFCNLKRFSNDHDFTAVKELLITIYILGLIVVTIVYLVYIIYMLKKFKK